MKKLLLVFSVVIMATCFVFWNSSITKGETQETSEEEQEYIEETLDLSNNEEQEWTYYEDSDAWVLSIVSAVAYPEIEDEQGVSVCVPGAYITGIDTDGDGTADITADTYTEAVNGELVIDYDAEITSTNGQVYTAATAPVILNTGAAGYSSSTNSEAATTYAAEGYINVSCGNRGKQDTVTDDDGNVTYTGDAPLCLVDQKNAARYVKYNILLGNLPGSVDYFVSTGGSGGGAHATMFAATSNNSDYYDYEIDAGAVGVYLNSDGTYSTTVDIDGSSYEISDGAWGCIAYSAITSLYEADIAMAFEYYMDTTYEFNTDFQAQMAEYLSESYMEYINEQELTVDESDYGFDINEDGDTEDTVALTIEYDIDAYPETNGYYGTYLNLYLDEFIENLQWYLDNLDYSEGWTWFDEDGSALSDEEVAAMTSEEKATAFIEGRYAKSDSSSSDMGGDMGEMPDDSSMDDTSEEVGTPDAGTTQSSTSGTDSENYSTFAELLEGYASDIEDIYSGDQYGNNIVELYNPLNYIGDEDTESATWVRIVMGASEGDMSMFSSLNLQIAWINAGVDCEIEWQWDGGHVPSEVLGESFSLYVDEMYGEYVEDAVSVTKDEATTQTENGTATEATGTDISSWISYDDVTDVSFTLADAVAYRTAGASKAIPGFDVIDYGQEDYVFGDSDSDARHWDIFVLDVLEEHQDELSVLFNASTDTDSTDDTDTDSTDDTDTDSTDDTDTDSTDDTDTDSTDDTDADSTDDTDTDSTDDTDADSTDDTDTDSTDDSSITVYADSDSKVTGDIPSNSVFSYESIDTDSEEYIEIAEILAGDDYDDIGTFVVYDLELTSDGETVEITDDGVEVTMMIPDELSDADEITVFVLEDDGTLTELSCDVDDGSITFNAPHFSTYVFAEVVSDDSSLTSTDSTSAQTGDSSETCLMASALIISIVALGIVRYIRIQNIEN